MSDAAMQYDDYYTDYPEWKRPVFRLVKGGIVHSFAEYAEIEERVEVLDGEVFAMASPTTRHQNICGRFYQQLLAQLDGKPCQPYISPLDVELFPNEWRKLPTIVQPDVFVVCDPSKVDPDGHIRGVPDFILEVLSESSYDRDLVKKTALYERAGVTEYWALDMEGEKLHAFIYDKEESQKYAEISVLKAEGIVHLRTLRLQINFDDIRKALG
ncbi:MAG: Uma2 family endonuclease [Spirochaetaceae bacterium]|jgi:Uma2 family endonuclease|nr:Uma2 family endonuclease [Spirochaetaceae bacterium]